MSELEAVLRLQSYFEAKNFIHEDQTNYCQQEQPKTKAEKSRNGKPESNETEDSEVEDEDAKDEEVEYEEAEETQNEYDLNDSFIDDSNYNEDYPSTSEDENENYSLYTILEIKRSASQSEIRKNYRKLVLQWHPDKHLDCGTYASEKTKALTRAFRILGNLQTKAKYGE